jgi:hypothetical protein
MSTPESPVSAGSTKPAGEGLSDEDAVAEVADQTSNDQKAEDVFERESDGTTTDAPAEDATADDVAD